MIHSDWHIHSEYSYDARTKLEALIAGVHEQDLKRIGVTDHVNYNDKPFLSDLYASAENIGRLQKSNPQIVLGVELTPIAKPHFDYIAKTGTREGFIPTPQDTPYDIELAVNREELARLGVRYAIGAAHWRVDVADPKTADNSMNALIREWYRQQMYLACDERVTVLGHPWYHGTGIWYEDFSVIPRSMNIDIATVLLKNGKYIECNSHFFYTNRATEKFRHQYAEFLRELFEMGIPVTYGSDCHGGPNGEYDDKRVKVEKYLSAAGFSDGDLSEIAENDLW
ncbi:MAG: PHP domain-containing protein [Clostridia bacterium]|nr:PHP domain-containing protein [Clostridia bacterium]